MWSNFCFYCTKTLTKKKVRNYCNKKCLTLYKNTDFKELHRQTKHIETFFDSLKGRSIPNKTKLNEV